MLFLYYFMSIFSLAADENITAYGPRPNSALKKNTFRHNSVIKNVFTVIL